MLNFDESVILILFAQFNGNSTPTAAQLTQFDADLQQDFGQVLLAVMAQEGLSASEANRSVVLGCRPHMPGNSAPVQIRSACRYVIAAHGALGTAAASAAAPAMAGRPAAPSGTVKAKRARRQSTGSSRAARKRPRRA